MDWLTEFIGVFRLLPLLIVMGFAMRNKAVLEAVIAVVYASAIVFGTFLGWTYSPAIFSTPLAYLVTWYMIKNVRRDRALRDSLVLRTKEKE